MPLHIVRAGGVLVFDHFLGLVRDGLVDLLERFLGSEQVVVFEKLAARLREPVELPGVALSALVVVQGDLRDDASVDEFLDVRVRRGPRSRLG